MEAHFNFLFMMCWAFALSVAKCCLYHLFPVFQKKNVVKKEEEAFKWSLAICHHTTSALQWRILTDVCNMELCFDVTRKHKFLDILSWIYLEVIRTSVWLNDKWYVDLETGSNYSSRLNWISLGEAGFIKFLKLAMWLRLSLRETLSLQTDPVGSCSLLPPAGK